MLIVRKRCVVCIYITQRQEIVYEGALGEGVFTGGSPSVLLGGDIGSELEILKPAQKNNYLLESETGRRKPYWDKLLIKL